MMDNVRLLDRQVPCQPPPVKDRRFPSPYSFCAVCHELTHRANLEPVYGADGSVSPCCSACLWTLEVDATLTELELEAQASWGDPEPCESDPDGETLRTQEQNAGVRDAS